MKISYEEARAIAAESRKAGCIAFTQDPRPRKKCTQCGAEFIRQARAQRLCGPECKRKSFVLRKVGWNADYRIRKRLGLPPRTRISVKSVALCLELAGKIPRSVRKAPDWGSRNWIVASPVIQCRIDAVGASVWTVWGPKLFDFKLMPVDVLAHSEQEAKETALTYLETLMPSDQ